MAKDATTEKPVAKSTTCKVVLSRAMKVDVQEMHIGACIAEVKLEPGVTLDFLGRALFDHHAVAAE